MRKILPGQKPKTTLSKIICGGIVALAMALLPLPALADQAAPAGGQQPSQSQQTTQAEQPQSDQAPPAASSTAASAAPADSSGAPQAAAATVTQPDTPPAGKLQATPDSNASSISLQDAAAPAGSDTPAATSSPATGNTATDSPQAAISTKNNVTSQATSGDAAVVKNRDAGDAASGGAEAAATVLNVANANGISAADFQTFDCNIRQDIQSDIVIDPTTLLPFCDNRPAGGAATGAAGGGQSLQSGASLVDILNTIVLSAASGSATVDSNRDAGNATTGDASAIANIVNIANSAINAQHSFLGVVNIYGNVQGNILVPQSLVDGLARSGAISTAGGNTTIDNTIDAKATSGSATVADNRTGGNATTGDATTSLTVMNLTGQQVVAKNSLLVFVNVLGKWLGMIVPAPGSRTALLGSGLQSADSAPSPGQLAMGGQANITNNISVSAISGDAAVTNNRDAGNATSGRAAAGVNLLNISNSQFLLSDWFGALFINVLGSWLGNFDIQSAIAANGGQPPVSDVQVFQLQQPAAVGPAAPTAVAAGLPRASRGSSAATDLTASSAPASAVLGASTRQQPSAGGQGSHGIKLDLLSLVAVVAALTTLTAFGTAAIRNRIAG